MARAATAGELVKFRGTEQWSILGLAIQPATTVYTARINEAFTAWDSIADLTYDTGSGTLAEVLEGMTLWVGSTAGAYDRGVCRIRKAPTATVLYINETSEIQFADNDFLTVVNTFQPWQRHLTQTGRVTRMDLDLDFPTATGGYATPLVRMGPTCAVLRLTGATVSIQLTVAGYSPITTISSYSTAAPGASGTSGLTTTTPTVTYNAAGTYRVATTVTDANGGTGVGYRWIFVNPTNPGFNLTSCSGDFENGGWSFDVECYSGVNISTVYDGALACLWGRDFYGGVEGSIGPVANYENIICQGWVVGESIAWNPDQSTVTFTVKSLDWWLDRENAYPVGILDNAAPDVWTEFPTLTVDDIMYHFCVWRSTVSLIADCYFTSDTRRMRLINVPTGTLWAQLKQMADDTIFAKPMVNALGQLYVEIDTNLLATADRSGIPTVQLIGATDWLESIDLQRNPTPALGFVELSGVKTYDGTSAPPLFSRAPGTVAKHYGSPEAPGNHLFATQAQCSQIAGDLLAEANVLYEATIPLTNERLIDICPRQYVTLTIVAADTPLGITMTAQKFIPRRVEREQDPETGLLRSTITCVQETDGADGITYTPPDPPSFSTPPIVPPIVDIPPIIITPPTLPPPTLPPPPGDTGDCSDVDAPENSFGITWDKYELNAGTTYEARHAFAWFPVCIRPAAAVNDTYLEIPLVFYGQTLPISTLITHVHVYGVSSNGTRLITATNFGAPYYSRWTFGPVSEVCVAGFEIELDADPEADFLWALGSAISIFGGPHGPDSDGDTTGAVLVIGNRYIIRVTSGIYAWRETAAGSNRIDTKWDLTGGTTWSGVVANDGATDILPVGASHVSYDAGPSLLYLYFIATTTSARGCVNSTSFGDNVDVSGGLISELFRASLSGDRRVYLAPSAIHNACGTT